MFVQLLLILWIGVIEAWESGLMIMLGVRFYAWKLQNLFDHARTESLNKFSFQKMVF